MNEDRALVLFSAITDIREEYIDEASRARNEASELKRELFKLQNRR